MQMDAEREADIIMFEETAEKSAFFKIEPKLDGEFPDSSVIKYGPYRWRKINEVKAIFLKSVGIPEKDIDDYREVICDTSIYFNNNWLYHTLRFDYNENLTLDIITKHPLSQGGNFFPVKNSGEFFHVPNRGHRFSSFYLYDENGQKTNMFFGARNGSFPKIYAGTIFYIIRTESTNIFFYDKNMKLEKILKSKNKKLEVHGVLSDDSILFSENINENRKIFHIINPDFSPKSIFELAGIKKYDEWVDDFAIVEQLDDMEIYRPLLYFSRTTGYSGLGDSKTEIKAYPLDPETLAGARYIS